MAETYVDFDASPAIPLLRVGENVLAIHGLNVQEGSDMLIAPELIARQSTLVQSERIGYLDMPTPGHGNADATFRGFVADPTVSGPHGFYNTAQSVVVTTSTPGTFVVYTLDGSTPEVDENLNIVNGQLAIGPVLASSTTTLRARAFKADFRPSFVTTATYLFLDDVVRQSTLGETPAGWAPNGTNGQEMDYGMDPEALALYGEQNVKASLQSISTIAISTDVANLFDPATGI